MRGQRTKVAHPTSRWSHRQGLALRSPAPTSRTATPGRQLGPCTAAGAPGAGLTLRLSGELSPPSRSAPQLSDLPRSGGLGAGRIPRGPQPLPGARLRAARQPPSAQPLLWPGASLSSSGPSRRQPAAPSKEGGGRRRRGRGGERGGRKARESELLRSRTSQSLPGARTPLLSGPSVPAAARCSSPPPPLPLPPPLWRLSPPPSSSCWLGLLQPPAPTRAQPQLSGVTPGTRALAPSFLPSSPHTRPHAPGLPPGSRLSPSPPQSAGASPCPESPSHFLSRLPPRSRRARDPQPPLPGSSPPRPGKGRVGELALAQPRAPALLGEEGPGR